MRPLLRLLRTVILLLILAFVFVPGKAGAGNISIAPLRQELELKPGQSFTSRLQVRNNSSQPSTINLSAESFGVINENYDYSFAKSEGIKDWLNFDKPQLALAPNDSSSSGYTLGVPNNAEPGEKYIALF